MLITKFTPAPDLHICPATSQVFNRTAYNKTGKEKIGKLVGASEVLKFQSMMTVGQLLEYSPSADDLISECIVRRPLNLEFFYLRRKECYKAFNVTKYYTLEYICYTVNLVPLDGDNLYHSHHLNLAINYPGVYYEVTLDSIWLQVMNNFRILAVQRGDGDDSLALAPVISRGLENGVALYDFFRVSNYKIHYHRLPPPYDTKCRRYEDEGHRSATDCENKCINQRSQNLINRFWYGSRAYKSLNQRPLSSNDMHNKTLAAIVGHIGSHCQHACAQAECDTTWAITRVTVERQNIGITFSVVAPKRPSFYIYHDAQLTIESYLIYAMSCVGSWFGLSVLSFNPVTVKERSKRRPKVVSLQDGATKLGVDAKKGMAYLVKLIKDMNHMKSLVKSHPPLVVKRGEIIFQRRPMNRQTAPKIWSTDPAGLIDIW
ncbi:hypothetical protein HDE_01917 [Halotydeus destructor]|nr:hypothetical protein HDE_01917 [Halotydeus destructor]